MYLISICLLISETNTWGGNLSNKGTVLFITGITVYLLVCMATFFIFSRKKDSGMNLSKDIDSIDTSIKVPDIDLIITILIIVYEVFALIKFYLEIRNSIRSVSVFSSFGEMVGTYRDMTSFDKGYSVGVSSFSLSNYRFMMIMAYIYMDIIVQHMVTKKKTSHLWKLLHWMPILLFAACALLNGGRNPIIQVILAFIVMYYIKYRQFNNEINIKAKTIIKIIVLGIVTLIAFSVFRGVVGRTSTYSTWDYLAIYIGAPLKLFDLFVNGGSISHIYVGQETFANLLSSLGANISNGANLEFRIFNGWQLGNVYTPFRRYYSDFGIWGLIILTAMEAFFYAFYYLKIRNNKFKPNSLDFPVLLYSYFAVGPFYYSIVERFYLFLSRGLITTIAEMFIISMFITKIKVKRVNKYKD